MRKVLWGRNIWQSRVIWLVDLGPADREREMARSTLRVVKLVCWLWSVKLFEMGIRSCTASLSSFGLYLFPLPPLTLVSCYWYQVSPQNSLPRVGMILLNDRHFVSNLKGTQGENLLLLGMD